MLATFREPDAVPGVVASIQSFGSLLNWHPHLHCPVTDGAFKPDDTLLRLGHHEVESLTEVFRRAVWREFVPLELPVEKEGQSVAARPHSGFHVHHSVRLEAGERSASGRDLDRPGLAGVGRDLGLNQQARRVAEESGR